MRGESQPLQGHNDETIWQLVWRTKAWRLYAILLVYMSGLTLTIPVVPTLMTNDFASRRAGHRVACEELFDDPPEYCQNAHSDIVLWSTTSGFFQNTIVAVLLTPALGAWSDSHGRKPFILLAQLLTCFPLLILLLNVTIGLPLYLYYVVQIITGAVSSITPALAYIADVIPPQHRAACFGGIMASFSLAILIGPPIGAQLAPETAPVAALVTVVACMVVTAVALPESLKPETVAAAAQAQAALNSDTSRPGSSTSNTSGISSNEKKSGWPSLGLDNTRKALAILQRNKLFRRLTIVLMLSSAVMEGLGDLLLQYLQLKIHFNVKDVSHLFMIFGACALLVQAVLLRSLLDLFGEQRVLVLGLSAYIVQQLALAAAHSKNTALVAIAIGSIGSVTFPTISSIKSNNAEEHEQGSVQGALYGARALASGTGPLLFAWLFRAFTRTDSTLPYTPGAPFVFGACVMVVAVGMAMRLPVDAGGNCGKLPPFGSTSGGTGNDDGVVVGGVGNNGEYNGGRGSNGILHKSSHGGINSRDDGGDDDGEGVLESNERSELLPGRRSGEIAVDVEPHYSAYGLHHTGRGSSGYNS